MSRALLFIAGLSLAGCGGPTVESVCEDLQTDCGVGRDECVADGEHIEELADEQGCDAGFEDYLDCIDASGCDTAESCADIRVDLETCLGAPFPS